MNTKLTTNFNQLRSVLSGAVFLSALVVTPLTQAESSFELRLDTSYLNGAKELESGRIDKAIPRLKFEYTRAGLSKRERQPAAIALCAAYIMKADVEQATEVCDKAVEFHSSNALARNNRGVLNMALGHYESALADFERAVEQRPHFAEAKRNRDRAYVRFAGQQKDAGEQMVSQNK